ncbi:uncharacterized protein FMAN_13039 [Fusarium mangiferae]|uniref:Uncharacterized protein n=1 Tax=Fusarium mangiferae TaxID=192010 RepID=A0A1L7UBM8_FUSMA|nr:uncharacterized protein FMAN_13039 [Fusarium mangiferae]CVL05077.1 uncharacterized protein FMAN_13039 [Fusarium mangiferae]
MGDDARHAVDDLAHALGFHDGQQTTYVPYLNYIQGCWPGKRTKNEFVQLFAEVVTFFIEHHESSVQSYIDSLVNHSQHTYFQDTLPASKVRKIAVEDAVLLILGSWTLMRTYFIPLHGRPRHIFQVASNCQSDLEPMQQSLFNLIGSSGLIPNSREALPPIESVTQPDLELDDMSSLSPSFANHSSAGLIESLSIEARDLNLSKLMTLARVRLIWTDNLSRHLLLSRRGQKKYLELFALPCALHRGSLNVFGTIGISADLLDEIESSYANLFNPIVPNRIHKYVENFIGLRLWCWCLSCSSQRLKSRELRMLKSQVSRVGRRNDRFRHSQLQLPYDPMLDTLAGREATWWDQTEFENLWPRILALEKCLQEARPWSFWVLLRDKRDTVQYWTFLFGTVILALTMVQVVLGALQVSGS